jgi:feruloyl esterase
VAEGVGYGFAAMSTDTGHSSISSDITWALNAPERKVDFGYRAMHGSVTLAKRIVTAHYGSASEFNYFSGCSTGGRQGLKEIQMYPEDFDGVLIGAPAWWTSHLQPWSIQTALYNLPTSAAHHIPASLFPAIGREVLRQCDGQDGVMDDIISDPAGCHFCPQVGLTFLLEHCERENLAESPDLAQTLLCPSHFVNQTAVGCLFPAQIPTVQKIHSAAVANNKVCITDEIIPCG